MEPMVRERPDRRVRRTQMALAKALIALTLERGYDAISVRDITERADVGYATFFRHFSDKDALLADVLQVVLEELPAELTRSAFMPDAAGAIFVFEYVRQHSEIVGVLLRTPAVRQNVLDMCLTIARAKQDLNADGIVPAEVAAYYTVSAALVLIDWWLAQGMPYTPERMGEIAYELLIRPRQAAALEAEAGPLPC